VEGCLACDLATGRIDLPGGEMLVTDHWIVEHTVGPLSLGTLIVKPKRHVVHYWELDQAEAAEIGPLLRRVSTTLADLIRPEQVYIGLWSHAGGVPVHIHFVVQPVTRALMDSIGDYGPHLQTAMFDAGVTPPKDEVEDFADRARAAFGGEGRA
jgi:diadenosine tetraphosphate (Ap4A) HIT family hydrolase